MAKSKEIWVRFCDTETYSENEDKLLSILSKASGNCVVKVYIESTRGCKVLHGWSFDKERLSLLTDGDGEQYKCKVLMYALCDDGEIYPLYFDRELAISPLSEAAFDVELYEMENGILDYFKKQKIAYQVEKLEYGDYSFMIPVAAAGRTQQNPTFQ